MGAALGHSTIRNLLTNRALIGRVTFNGPTDADGNRASIETAAKWAPMVDVAEFREVEKRLSNCKVDGKGRQRKRPDLYPLEPACAHCGVAFNGNRLSVAQGEVRGYSHAVPKERMHLEAFQRHQDAKCKAWYVNADELEGKIKDLIVRERASAQFEDEVRELILQRDTYRQSADEAIGTATAELSKRQGALKRLAHIAAALAAEDDSNAEGDDPIIEKLRAAKDQVTAAKRRLADAEALATSKESAWEGLSAIIHETRNLAAAWDHAGPEERKVLLDYWVYDVLIVVEPVPGMKRANRKTAVVTLRTAPGAPRHFLLEKAKPKKNNRGQPAKREIAERSAAITRGSLSSPSIRESNDAVAASDPIFPSAQAACSLTSGSESDNAAISAGNAEGSPAFPSTTAALRLSPLSLARFIGEPLNAAENSGCDMASSSRASVDASLPAMTGRAANDGSESSRANLWVYGHTSWQMSHP